MNTRSCDYLIAIQECGSLSGAAKRLGVSQPTLSSFLAGAERQLGHILFQRRQKSMVPTEAGLIYLDACRRIVETKNRTYHSIQGLSNQYGEVFTVGATPHRGSTMFARVYSRFYLRHPEVLVNLREGYIASLIEMLDRGEVDLLIGGVANDMVEKYRIISHYQEELFLCVPDFHPLAALAGSGETPGSIDIRRFQDTPFVMWGDQTANYRTLKRFFRDCGISPTVVYESNNVQLIDNMLSGGLGVGFLPQGYCKAGQKRKYFSMEPPLRMDVGMYYRKDTTLTKAQRYFVYLSIWDQLLHSIATYEGLNAEAKEIYDEFKEGNDGYTPA